MLNAPEAAVITAALISFLTFTYKMIRPGGKKNPDDHKSDEYKTIESKTERLDKDIGKLGEKARGHDTFIEVQKKENHYIKESVKRIENNTGKLFDSQSKMSTSINDIKVLVAAIAKNGNGKK